MATSDAPRPLEPILHVDMDAFYASVEVRDDPSLTGRPVLVGGAGGRGVVAAASYEARTYGIHSAMPMARALRLCPHAVVRSPNFQRYQQVSADLMELFHSVTPLVEPLSLDEAFLDVGGSVRLFGDPVAIGQHLRERIRVELGLPASVGVASNKFLAKLCSGKAKPDGLFRLEDADTQTYLRALSVRDLWGVGEQTSAKLDRFGLRTIGDLNEVPASTLQRILGTAVADQLLRLAHGIDERAVVVHEPARGMSAEETFDIDIDDPRILRTELLRLSEKVARRLRRAEVAGRTVVLKLRYANFATVTRSRTMDVAVDQATELHATVADLLDALRLERVRVRLVGVGVTNLVPADAARQLRLLGPDRWGHIERVADLARDRFGEAAVTRGALIDDDRPTRAHPSTPGAEDIGRR